MKTMGRIRGKRMAWLLAVSFVAAMAVGVVQAKAGIDGTWVLEKPQLLLTPADGGPVPFTEEGRKLYEQNKAAARSRDYSFDETINSCASPGVPRAMLSPNRFMIVERAGKVLFLFEWNRLFRQIDMRDDTTIENSKALDDSGTLNGFNLYAQEEIVGSQIGHARGVWQGNTLAVETSRFVDGKLLDGLIQTSDELKLSEHFRLRGRNTLEYRFTIADPVTFTQPWEAVLIYKRQRDEVFAEDVCLERKKAGEAPWPG